MAVSIGSFIGNIHRKSQNFLSRSLKDVDISHGEYALMIRLFEADGVTQEQIVRAMGLDKAAVTRMVQSLEKKGYLIRTKKKADRRCNELFLTDAGRALEPQIRKAVKDWKEMLCRGLSEEEIQQADALLEKMWNNVINL